MSFWGTDQVGRLLNVTRKEWPRVWVSWFINFLFRFGFVVGWSMLTGMFVSRFGIEKLPILFIVNSVCIIIGTLFYSTIIERIRREWLMIGTVISAAILLVAATLFISSSTVLFFSFLLFAESVLLTQLNIIIISFREELFSPLESERVFPVIESSETIGGIIAGITVTLGASYFPVYKLIFIWVIALVLIVPIILYANRILATLPGLEENDETDLESDDSECGLLARVRSGIDSIRKIPFLKGLLVVILLHWLFVNVLEFQYTKAVEQVVTDNHEETLVFHEYGRIFNISLLTDPGGVTGDHSVEVEAPAVIIPSVESALVKKLGSLQILFGVLALGMQLFLTSRLLHSLGIVGSLLLYPVIMLLSLVGLFLKFGFTSAVITKANFEIANIIQRNAYHSSYYALKNKIRERAREFLEGFIRPIGGIIGMGILIFLQSSFSGKILTGWINMILVMIMFVMFFVLLKLKERYTLLSKHMLFEEKDELERWDAVEILGQHGHVGSTDILINAFRKFSDDDELRAKIIRTIGESKDFEALPIIVDAFTDPSYEVRFEAVRALRNFKDIGEKFDIQLFSRYRVITALKEMFWEEKEPHIREEIIRAFTFLKEPDTVHFLLEILDQHDPVLSAQCIQACGHFHDPAVAHFILPYLNSKYPDVRINTMITLWQFPSYRMIVQSYIEPMLESNITHIKEQVYRFVAAVKYEDAMPFLLNDIQHEDSGVKLYAALALAEMGHRHIYTNILGYLENGDVEFVHKVKYALESLSIPVANRLRRILSQALSLKIHNLLEKQNMEHGKEFSVTILEQLKKLYDVLDHKREVHRIESIIAHRK
ncbi:MAG: MFS transporter [Patescibacteria group bacterium]